MRKACRWQVRLQGPVPPCVPRCFRREGFSMRGGNMLNQLSSGPAMAAIILPSPPAAAQGVTTQRQPTHEIRRARLALQNQARQQIRTHRNPVRNHSSRGAQSPEQRSKRGSGPSRQQVRSDGDAAFERGKIRRGALGLTLAGHCLQIGAGRAWIAAASERSLATSRSCRDRWGRRGPATRQNRAGSIASREAGAGSPREEWVGRQAC